MISQLNPIILLQFVLFSNVECSNFNVLKKLSYSVRRDSNETIISAHISWTDEYDDSFSHVYTNENGKDGSFRYERPKPEIHIIDEFIRESVLNLFNVYTNHSLLEKFQISMPYMLDEISEHFNNSFLLKPNKTVPFVKEFRFNTFDRNIYETFLENSDGTPFSIKISFFAFDERVAKFLDGDVLLIDKIRRSNEIDLSTIESDVSDEELQQLKCLKISIRSSSLSNRGINKVLKDWQDGKRSLEYLKIIDDDLQQAEVLDGILKKTVQHSTWKIKDRFGQTSVVSISRVPSNLFDPKPTLIFNLSN